MAQLDKLLPHVASRGAQALRLEPNQPPSLEMGDGTSAALLPNPLPGTLIELLAKEIMPPDAGADWASGREPQFDYGVGGQTFRVRVQRTAGGPLLRAELGPASGGAVIELDLERAPQATQPVALAQAPSPPPPPAAAAPTPAAPGQAVAIPGKQECGSHPLAEALFSTLMAMKGSDIHCSSFEAPIARVHGDMTDLADFGILGPTQLLEIMEALATPDTWQHFLTHNDADFAYPFDKGGCRLRVNYFMDRQGPGFVCRVIPSEIPNPDKLGIPDPIRALADLAKGLVLVTGPTGSGKSTTLAAIIDLVNQRRSDHILTIEDPIEFVHPRKQCLVNQREVGTHTDSFKTGLRAALREDPDVILVGEMRDLETIAIALETAVTGHLVFGTLHTNSAIGTIDRIVDQFPADRQQQIRQMLADSLKCVISQILLKKVGGGRVAALESLFVTPAISNLIREAKVFQIPSAMQTGRAYGQRLMNDALVELIKDGKVEVMEAYMKCPDKESFIQHAKRNGINCDPRGMESGG
jgi:twitching motility protein PilT